MVVIKPRAYDALLFSIDTAIIDPEAKLLRQRPAIRNLINMALSFKYKFTCAAVTDKSEKEAKRLLRLLSCDNSKLIIVSEQNGNPYKAAAEKLGIAPRLCAAFEGSDKGRQIALDTGIGKIIDVRSNPRPDKLKSELITLCGLTPDRP